MLRILSKKIAHFPLPAVLLLFLLSSCANPSVATEAPLPTVTRTALALGPTEPSTPIPATATTEPPLPTAIPIPGVSDQDWRKGPDSAPVRLVVYSDFQ